MDSDPTTDTSASDYSNLTPFLQELLTQYSSNNLTPNILFKIAELQMAYSIEKNDPHLERQMQTFLRQSLSNLIYTATDTPHQLEDEDENTIPTPQEVRLYMKYITLGKVIYDLVENNNST